MFAESHGTLEQKPLAFSHQPETGGLELRGIATEAPEKNAGTPTIRRTSERKAVLTPVRYEEERDFYETFPPKMCHRAVTLHVFVLPFRLSSSVGVTAWRQALFSLHSNVLSKGERESLALDFGFRFPICFASFRRG